MFKTLNPIKVICSMSLPAVYGCDLSYYEQLCKIQSIINDLIANNNNLPDLIIEAIKNIVNEEGIEKIVRDILSRYYINVIAPPNGLTPASGNGSTDDTMAIQGCIDYASDIGGVVFFPYGSYLTDSLVIKNNVGLVGESRNQTKIVLKQGATKPLISGVNVDDCLISGLTLDANGGNQVNDINCVSVIGSDFFVSECTLKDGNTLLSFNGLGGILQITNCHLKGAENSSLLVSGNSDVCVNGIVVSDVNTSSNQYQVEIDSDNGSYDVKLGDCNYGVKITGNNNVINGQITSSENPINDAGIGNIIDILSYSFKKIYNGNGNLEVDNLGVRVNDTYTKNIGTCTENIDTYTKKIDTYTENIGAYTENISRDKNVVVTGDTNVNYSNFTETSITHNETTTTKNSTSRTSTETVEGDKIINSDNLDLNTKNPFKYKTPVKGTSNFFDNVPIIGRDGKTYNLLVENQKTSEINVTSNQYINLLDYYDGNNFDDAIEKAIAACPIHGTLFIPYGTYIANKTIVINKPITILGEYTCFDPEESTKNYPSSAVKNYLITVNANIGILIESIGVRLENLSVKCSGIGSGSCVIKGTLKNVNSNTGVLRDISFKNLYLEGVEDLNVHSCTDNIILFGDNIITSYFEDVRCYFGNYSFAFTSNEQQTSLTFINCWAVNMNVSGYYFNNLIYSTLISCACDTFHGGDTGYTFVNCKNVTVIGCGCEKTGVNCAFLTNCAEIVLNMSLISYGEKNTGVCAGLQIRDSSNILCLGCVSYDNQNELNKSAILNANSTFMCIGCNFTSVKDNTETSAITINGNYRKEKVTFNLANCTGDIKLVTEIGGCYLCGYLTPTTSSPTINVTGISASNESFYGISNKNGVVPRCTANVVYFDGNVDTTPFNFKCKITN